MVDNLIVGEEPFLEKNELSGEQRCIAHFEPRHCTILLQDLYSQVRNHIRTEKNRSTIDRTTIKNKK
jgi:hypothetical protein